MWRTFLCLAILAAATLNLWVVRTQAHPQQPIPPPAREIAITIDDLPLNGPQFDAARLQVMTRKLLGAFNQYQVPAVGFVNESLIYQPGEAEARIAILKAWSDAGIELGNHTFSHLGFSNASLADYEDDFIRGDTILRMLLRPKEQKPRYFRHPFLQMGSTLQLEKAFEAFIAERGYQAAPITIDSLDWYILAAYRDAQEQQDSEMLKRVSAEYIRYNERKFDYCEQAAADLFGRPIKHILLLHANELNGDNLDDLLRMLKKRGYQFIPLEQALKDPVYQFPDQYQPTSDWLSHWSASKGRPFNPPAPPDFIQSAYLRHQR
ncbi:MAG TPA: polysaccharide deacetylase family protein [Blastocatellia bacterium]|nr:polysaccharide deacetylase family protein [Blastocatellia bacterium]